MNWIQRRTSLEQQFQLERDISTWTERKKFLARTCAAQQEMLQQSINEIMRLELLLKDHGINTGSYLFDSSQNL
jgi:hypothetical protein